MFGRGQSLIVTHPLEAIGGAASFFLYKAASFFCDILPAPHGISFMIFASIYTYMHYVSISDIKMQSNI